jgi:tRNA threonylcarbamoyladenosine biosynthesis protein TsaB
MPDSKSTLILSLETATRTGSVALARGHRLLALRSGEAQTSHSTKLLQTVEEILEETGTGLAEVELFAAASGPGSFTGLRIGLATIKSFAATLSRPCAGISTLSAVAHAAGPSKHTLALIPAGRGEVFAQLLAVSDDREVTPLGEAVHRTPEKLLDSVMSINRLKWAGEGLQLYEPVIKQRAALASITLTSEATLHLESLNGQDKLWTIAQPVGALAGNVATLAYRRHLRGETLRPEQLEAIYVRPSDAELNAREL